MAKAIEYHLWMAADLVSILFINVCFSNWIALYDLADTYGWHIGPQLSNRLKSPSGVSMYKDTTSFHLYFCNKRGNKHTVKSPSTISSVSDLLNIVWFVKSKKRCCNIYFCIMQYWILPERTQCRAISALWIEAPSNMQDFVAHQGQDFWSRYTKLRGSENLGIHCFKQT